MQPDESFTFEYPWQERPGNVPLTKRELEIALEASDWKAAATAKLLRVTVERLTAFILADGNEKLADRIAERAVSEAVTIVRCGWAETMIVIRKPSPGHTLRTSVNEDGNLVVRITRDGTSDMRQRAEEVLREAAAQPEPRPAREARAAAKEQRRREAQCKRAVAEWER